MKLISPILSHQWFVFKNGVPTLSAESVERLKQETEVLAWRNELHEIFYLTNRCPWTVIKEMTNEMISAGIGISGIRTDLANDSFANQFNLVIQHQQRLCLPARWLSQFRFSARELMQPNLEAKEAVPCHDQFKHFSILQQKRSLYSRYHEMKIDLDFKVQPKELSSDATVVDDFRLLQESNTGLPSTTIRHLPYPYRNYLSINTDIDWTTREQLEEFNNYTQEIWGQPWGGSVYFSAQSPDWVSLSADKQPLDQLSDSVDTIHSWVDTIEVLNFKQNTNGKWVARGHGAYGALIVWLSGESRDLVANLSGADFSWQEKFHSVRSGKTGEYAVTFGAKETVEFPSQDIALTFANISPGVKVTRCFLCSLNPISIRNWVRVNANIQSALKPPIFTYHGGGEFVREIAGLRVGLVKERFPDLLGCDFDDCGSPFYLVPELEALGIIFLNPRGSFVSRAPVSITELLSDVKLDDGSSWYIFRRFMSKRHEELGLGEHFNFGKSISHPEALEFVLSDLLNRFANAREPGTGAIIYTHLGHKLGEQLSPGLGWPKLMHNWIDEVRRAFRFDGRIWFASASEILRFALVRKALLSAENCRISNGEIVIKSWVDPIRNIKLPGEETSWLSGQTIYVNKADGINVSLDGQPYTKGWKNNPADDSGNESVTLN